MGGSHFVSASASSQELRQRVSVLPLSRGITPTTHVSPESYAAAPVTNEMLLQIEGLIRANNAAIVSNTVKTDLAFDFFNNVVETMAEVKTNLATNMVYRWGRERR